MCNKICNNIYIKLKEWFIDKIKATENDGILGETYRLLYFDTVHL
jgi:hypothetical protein